MGGGRTPLDPLLNGFQRWHGNIKQLQRNFSFYLGTWSETTMKIYLVK